LATSIFGLSIAANIYFLIFAGILGGGGDGSRTTTLVSGDIKQKIAVVPITGVIDENTADRFEKTMKRLESDENVKAIVLDVDTPGGGVSASDEIYDRVLKFKENKHVPVVVTMGSLAASGGYYISCSADKIVAQRTTITGSIGVLMPRYDLSKLGEKYGVADDSIHSTGATYKTVGSPLKPITPDERQYLTSLIDDAFATFKEVVTKGRGTSLKKPIDEIANGKAYSASEALQLGLVDQLGYKSDAYDLAAQLAHLNNKYVVKYEPIQSLFEALGASDSKFGGGSGGGGSPAAGPSGGININIDTARVLQELTTPKLMYLWRGQ
jgi:protease-4